MKRGFYWSILVFVFTIPISSFISTKLLIAFLFISLFLRSNKGSLLVAIEKSWDVLFFFLVLIMGLLNTNDIVTGLRVLETSFSLLALLFVFSRLSNFHDSLFSNMFLSFIAGLLVACLICLVSAGISFNSSGDFHEFFYYQLTDVIKLHPTYMAYYIIAAITYVIYMVYYRIQRISKKVLLPVSVFFFCMLMLTGGRTAYVSLLLVLAFFILKFMTDEEKAQKINGFLLAICLSMSLLGLSSLDYFGNELNISNDYWERSILWKSALKANPNPLLGVGTGDYKEVLNSYYQAHGMQEYAKDSYNSHNQFIQIYFSNGIIGLLALVIMLARPLYLSVRSHNTLGVLLFFPFIIYGVTEVFLGRYQGVVFFFFLHQIIVHQYYSNKPYLALKGD